MKDIYKIAWEGLIGVFLIVLVTVFIIRPSWMPWEDEGTTVTNGTNSQSQVAADTIFTEKLYPVVAVLNGESIAVEIDGKIEIVQAIGLRVPYAGGFDEPKECFAVQSAKSAQSKLIGKKISLHGDGTQQDKDISGRLLRYIFLEDGTDYNKYMIENGFAYERMVNPAVSYQAQEDFKKAEAEARESKRGLWGNQNCDNQ